MPGVFKIKNVDDAEFTLTHPDGAGAVSIDSNNIAKIDAVNAALALKANTADLKEIGVGQTWQDMTGSRVAGTTYTNSTGKPIEVSIAWSLGGISTQTSPLLEINGINILSKTEDGTSYAGNTVIAIVGAGATYRFTLYSPQIKTHWKELR